MDHDNPDDLYRIGTVASLTGISIERLRAWERRYGLSPAQRSGRTRYYSRDQLERLKLIKHLTDQGQAISSLANLSSAQLQARMAEHPAGQVVIALHNPTVGLIGPNLLTLEQQEIRANRRMRIDVAARWANSEAFQAEQTANPELQAVIVQLPVLSLQAIEKIGKLSPSAAIVAIYQFATAQAVSDLQERGIATLKWPVSWSEIEHTTLSGGLTAAAVGKPAPRRFSDEELIAIAATSEDPSECPEHLIESIHQLNALSAYLKDCPADSQRRQLYQRAHADACTARAHLELALETLLSSDNIEHGKVQGLNE